MEKMIKMPRFMIDYIKSIKRGYPNATLRQALFLMLDSFNREDKDDIIDFLVSNENQIKFSKVWSGEFEGVEEDKNEKT